MSSSHSPRHLTKQQRHSLEAESWRTRLLLQTSLENEEHTFSLMKQPRKIADRSLTNEELMHSIYARRTPSIQNAVIYYSYVLYFLTI